MIYSKDSKAIGDHDRFNEALRFLIYNMDKQEHPPKASLQLPDLAPKLVVLEASKTPACIILGAAYIRPLQSLGSGIFHLDESIL
jgi:hypothetical protein